ncbi:REP-associated tyrosine transposase [Chitinimonas taiwanensis]|uniref:REP-associated tyrosine transposase n=1 Tax=Chitinimonas taiwanensis TaxID=240412 RepID=UPI0035B0F650
MDALRQAFRTVRQRHPFDIIAMVVLPDHLHAIWTLPPDDVAYAMRWSLIKAAFSRQMPAGESIRDSRLRKRERERGIWQRRYWEHQIRDEADLQAQVDYIHFNPVKHGYVQIAADWPYSTIHREIARDTMPVNWAVGSDLRGAFGE